MLNKAAFMSHHTLSKPVHSDNVTGSRYTHTITEASAGIHDDDLMTASHAQVLQAIIRNDHVNTIVDEHGCSSRPIRINDDRAPAAPREKNGFVTRDRCIGTCFHAHRRA